MKSCILLVKNVSVQLYTKMGSRVVDVMAGADQLRELGPPLVLGEVFRMGMTGPDALEDDLVFGLVASAARLHDLQVKVLLLVMVLNLSR